MAPSDNWKTVSERRPNDLSVKAWNALSLDAIEQLGLDLRPGTSCKVNREKYASGTDSLALELVFGDGQVWIVRVRTDHLETKALSSDVARRIRSEVATMKLIKAQTAIPVATVFAYSSSTDNTIGLPYIVMSGIEGYSPMALGLTFNGCLPGKEDVLERYCASLANVHLQLSNIRSEKIGSIYSSTLEGTHFEVGPISGLNIGPFDRATTFYHENARRLQDLVLPHGDVSSTRKERALRLWLYRMMFAQASFLTQDTGPFLLSHLDLHMNNTLIDVEGNIVGILDWDSAAFLPVELFAAQMLNFSDNFFGDHSSYKKYFSVYQDMLRRHEQSTPVTVPGIRTSLADLHASVSCRLLFSLAYFMFERDDFERDKFDKSVCMHLFGTETVHNSLAFEEWYTGLARNLDKAP